MWDELLSSGRADGILLHNNPIYIIPQRKGIVKWENGDSLYFVEKYMGELHKKMTAESPKALGGYPFMFFQ
jgi:hypothetical protein